MNEKKDFFGIGMAAPFEDGTELEPCEWHGECIAYKREKGYEKLCKGCEAVTPEAMKDFISEDFCMEDEIYYCYWCDFIRAAKIEDLLVENEKVVSSKDAAEIYDDDEVDGYDAIWDLEDAGAFADEGIMPGCHSGSWEYESEVKGIMQEFENMDFIGKCIKLAREKAGLSIQGLAEKLELPKSFLEDIESGEYINRYSKNSMGISAPRVCPIPVAKPVENSACNQMKEERAWWQDCGDGSIKEKVGDYLCNILNPTIAKRNDKNVQSEDAGSEDASSEEALLF